MQIYHVVDVVAALVVVASVAAIAVDVANVVDQQCWKSKSLVFDQVQQFPKAKQLICFCCKRIENKPV